MILDLWNASECTLIWDNLIIYIKTSSLNTWSWIWESQDIQLILHFNKIKPWRHTHTIFFFLFIIVWTKYHTANAFLTHSIRISHAMISTIKLQHFKPDFFRAPWAKTEIFFWHRTEIRNYTYLVRYSLVAKFNIVLRLCRQRNFQMVVN